MYTHAYGYIYGGNSLCMVDCAAQRFVQKPPSSCPLSAVRLAMALPTPAGLAAYLGREVRYVDHTGADRPFTVWAVRLDGHVLLGGRVVDGFGNGVGMSWFDPARVLFPALAGPADAREPAALALPRPPAARAALTDERLPRSPSRSPRRQPLRVKITGAPAWATEEKFREHWATCGPLTQVNVIARRDGSCAGKIWAEFAEEAGLQRALGWDDTWWGDGRVRVRRA